MMFRGKMISQYSKEDIQSLIDNKVPESKTLDYKRELNFDEKGKTELIYDISSFYNTDGGCLIVGLDEEIDEQNKKTGIPKTPYEKKQISGFDGLILRIEEIIRQSTNPQITNLEFSELIDINGTHVYMIGIPKMKTLPAMVTYSNHNRFFKRKSNGKYTLDTYELYDTFMQVSILEERIAEFIKSRHFEIAQNNFWNETGHISSLLIHVIPIESFNHHIENFSSDELKYFFAKHLRIPGNGDYSYRYCLEGFHLYQNKRFDSEYDILQYNLIFRNGSTETFTNEPFFVIKSGEPPQLDGIALLTILKNHLEKCLLIFQKLSLQSAFYLSIKLNKIANMRLLHNGRLLGKFKNQAELNIPLILFSPDLSNSKLQLKNQLDILWQSVGVNECPTNDFDLIFNPFFKDYVNILK